MNLVQCICSFIKGKPLENSTCCKIEIFNRNMEAILLFYTQYTLTKSEFIYFDVKWMRVMRLTTVLLLCSKSSGKTLRQHQMSAANTTHKSFIIKYHHITAEQKNRRKTKSKTYIFIHVLEWEHGFRCVSHSFLFFFSSISMHSWRCQIKDDIT